MDMETNRKLYSDMMIEMIKFIVVTTYDGGNLHIILDVRATELERLFLFMKTTIKPM